MSSERKYDPGSGKRDELPDLGIVPGYTFHEGVSRQTGDQLLRDQLFLRTQIIEFFIAQTSAQR